MTTRVNSAVRVRALAKNGVSFANITAGRRKKRCTYANTVRRTVLLLKFCEIFHRQVLEIRSQVSKWSHLPSGERITELVVVQNILIEEKRSVPGFLGRQMEFSVIGRDRLTLTSSHNEPS